VKSGRRDHDVMFRELEFFKASVRAFCVRCEPELVCQDAECPLREVSPLPLVELPRRPMTTATPYDREAGLAALAAGARRARDERWHGEHGEENRERQRLTTAEKWAALSPEERAERIEHMREGRRRPGAEPPF